MSEFKSIAVAGGFGNFGGTIVQALLDSGAFQVKILSRKKQSHPSPDVELLVVDYTDEQSLVQALAGVDVVISTLNDYAILEPQLALIEASKKAGVKRFVPSEFVTDAEGKKNPIWEPSQILVKSLKESGLPYTIYQNGLFMEYVTSPLFGVDVASGTVRLYGEGNSQMDITSSSDVARFITYTINDPRSENRVYHVAGDRVTMNQLVSQLVEVTKISPVITRVNQSDFKHLTDMESAEFIHEHLNIEVEDGVFQFASLDNDEYPGFQFRTLKQFLLDNHSPNQ